MTSTPHTTGQLIISIGILGNAVCSTQLAGRVALSVSEWTSLPNPPPRLTQQAGQRGGGVLVNIVRFLGIQEA